MISKRHLGTEKIEFMLVFAYVIGMETPSITTARVAISKWFGSAALVFYLMPVLMALLVAGTLAQAEMGLYQAHKTFFSSFVFWNFYIPLPGGMSVLGILTLCLLWKFLAYSVWSWRKTGIILAHFGALILLLGGLLTSLFAREGYMVIPEGGQSAYVYDYHQRELIIFKDDAGLYAIPFEDMHAGQVLGTLNLPFTLAIESTCKNCKIQKREEFSQGYADQDLHGMARFMALFSQKQEKEAEANLSGITLRVSQTPQGQDGVYVAFEGMPKPLEITSGESVYKIILGKQQRELPFSIQLQDFERQSYPGTMKAKGYHSDVIVQDQGARWNARIEMNQPLRYKGYAFFQSSFDQNEMGETTVLSVVENKGRLFPYIGTLVLALGLALHLWRVLRDRKDAAVS